MPADFAIAIVGSGPAGLSAAARAAKEGKSHVLLERSTHTNDTIFKYQKHKHVMATPEFLPLRSDLDFKAESREEVHRELDQRRRDRQGQYPHGRGSDLDQGPEGQFRSSAWANGETITAEYVVLSIGVQGNLRPPHASRARPRPPSCQYQLDDPDEYKGEEIIVIGTGDAGIENALALCNNNNVSIINRVADFPTPSRPTPR